MNEWVDVEEMQPGIVPQDYNVTVQAGTGKPWVAMCFWDGAKFCIDAPSVVTAWWPRGEGPVPGAPPVPKVPEPDGWISVEAALPEDRRHYLAVCMWNEVRWVTTLLWDGYRFHVKQATSVVTHWQPLPEPPPKPGPFEPRAQDLCGRILHSVCYRGVR